MSNGTKVSSIATDNLVYKTISASSIFVKIEITCSFAFVFITDSYVARHGAVDKFSVRIWKPI